MVDWFKNFFGFPRSHEGMSDPFHENPGIDREDIFKDEFESFFHSSSPFADASDMFRHVEEMFKNFESMFHNFGREDFPLPSLEPPEHFTEDRREDNLRDKMLKIPDSNSSMDSNVDRREDSLFGGWTEDSSKMDTDLDAEIAKEPIDKIIPEISPKIPRFGDRYSFNSSSVSVRINSADGKIEEHRTVKDTKGNVNVTVRRSLGDKTYIITTKSDSKGESEKTEEFINMDEEGLKDFESKWQQQRHLPMLEDPSTRNPRDEVLKEKDSSYFSIIRRFFGRDSCSD